ncbi:MAG: hypothetical protein AAFU79_00760 [Myxococcota bacterium]
MRSPGLAVLLFSVLFGACRSHVGFREQYLRTLRPAINTGSWLGVAEALKQSRGDIYREEDRVMFWLNLGTAYHYADDLAASSKAFFQAEETIRELFTKSVSEEIGRFVANETVQTYSGEDYERILSYLYTSLNAAQQGRLNDALVEARRADAFLRDMRIREEKGEGSDTPWSRDAFMLWLVGWFLERERSYQDAYLAYQESWRAYETIYAPRLRNPPPRWLAEDLVRLARLTGRGPEAEDWMRRTGASGTSEKHAREGWAEIVIVHANGEAPFKQERNFTTVLPDGFLLRVAMPEIVAPSPPRLSAQLVVDGTTLPAERAEPVAEIALAQFRAREGALKARAIARAALKSTATQATSEAVKSAVREDEDEDEDEDRGRRRRRNQNDGSELAGALVSLLGGVASAASEGADLRSWTLLPYRFDVARMWVRPGRHDVSVELVDAAGRPAGSLHDTTMNLTPGARVIVSVRSLR